MPNSTPHVAQNSGNMEWYTPVDLMDAARSIMGGIDLDPASNRAANAIHDIPTIFTKEQDGLKQEWFGRIWLNPPYSRGLVDQFAAKLIQQWMDGNFYRAMWLSNNSTDTRWFQALLRYANAVCFPSPRIRFLNGLGEPVGKPLQGQAILGFGVHVSPFAKHMSKFGRVLYTA